MCSALCVFLGLGGMLFIRMPIFYTVAIGAMIVLTISLLLTLTLLPALLFMMGNRIQSEMRINSGSHQIKTSLWTYLSAAVMKRPVKVGLLASLILFWFILPLGQMNLAIPDASSLSKAYESRQAAELFDQYFTDPSTSQVFVMMEGEAHALQVEDWMGAYQIHEQLEKDPQVIQVDSVFSKIELTAEEWRRLAQSPILKEQFKAAITPFIQGNKLLMSITLRGHENSKVARDWVRDWERILLDKRALIGGEPKYQQEVYDEIFTNMDKVLLFIFISNFIVLLIAFRSILIPIKTIIMNLMSLGASFGILVWIFKEGHLGMEPSSIAIMIPVFIFGLTFGISMDYGVFLLSRIYEIYRKTGDNELSVKVGLALTSKMITSAATIMIVVTAPFALGTVVGVKQLGIGIAAAILIDATIIRMMLVPSLMKLLGRWNWWGP
ncbi:Membrane protein YdfJ [compost metagenome]